MKKIFIFVIISILGIGTSFAQKTFGELVLGMNLSDMTYFKKNTGFHAGFRGTYSFTKEYNGVYVNTGLILSLKGANIGGGPYINNYNKADFKSYYLDIPIHIGYKYGFNDETAIFCEFGPYFGMGLFGDCDVNFDGVKISGGTFDEGGVKRFDVGFGCRAGIEIIKRIPISIGYDIGIINIAEDSETSIKNSNITISTGYKF